MQNLREKETLLLGRMLTLTNTAGSAASTMDFNDQWKVLIYDQDCRDIISPLLNIGALRQKGVTLHMLITANREPVPDAPAVYFVRPTEENIKRITEDCAKQLYRTVYLNFLTRIDRPMIEKLAQDLTAANAVSMVSKIYDQYLDVIALEPNLFTLNIRDSFTLYNKPSLSEAQIKSFMSRVATGLLSTVRVMGTLPIIRAPPGGAAEMLAQELCGLLRENISSRGPAQLLFEDCLVNDRARPLMLIVDRSADLFPVLQHASTYQALINDLLDLKLNRVTLELPEKEGTGKPNNKKKTYDLNTQSDPFLHDYAGSPFPEAVDANEKELAEASRLEQAIRSRPDFAVGNADMTSMMAASAAASAVASMEGKGRDLSEAIDSLPEILQKKANLEAHTNILQAVMTKIAAREVPTYFELEQAILTAGGRVADKQAVLTLLRDGAKGAIEDKARLLMLLAVCPDAAINTKAAIAELDTAFTTGCEQIATETPAKDDITLHLAAVTFIRRLQALQSSAGGAFGGAGGGGSGMPSSSSNALLSSFLTTAHSQASSLMAKAATFFTKFTPYLVTRIVDNLAEGRACTEDDTFCFLDPRTSKDGSHQSAAAAVGGPGSGHKYADVIVFVLGGGTYSEYYNLNELLRDKASCSTYLRSIVYGCTDVLSGDGFVAQMRRLAEPAATAATTSATGVAK